MQLIISDKAKSDLLNIYRFLEERSPNAADVFVRRIDTSFDNLVRFPFIGRERPWLAQSIRVLWLGAILSFTPSIPNGSLSFV